MLKMLSKKSKILLIVYAFLLLVWLIGAETLSYYNYPLIFLILGTAVLTFFTGASIVNDIRKLNSHKASMALSAVLVSLILYSADILFFCLVIPDTGDEGGIIALIIISCVYAAFLVLSLIKGLYLVFSNKDKVSAANATKSHAIGKEVKNRLNCVLSLVLLTVLILLFYSSAVSGIARIISAPGVCSMHIELKSGGFIFAKGMRDSCIYNIAINTLSVPCCSKIKDTVYADDAANSLKNRCFSYVALMSNDTGICDRITNYDLEKSFCIVSIAGMRADPSLCKNIEIIDKDMCYFYVALGENVYDGAGGFYNNGNPETCNYIKKNELRYECYSGVAFNKKDAAICEKYSPTREAMIDEGLDPDSYSREECINGVY
jgi:hypothetical protein